MNRSPRVWNQEAKQPDVREHRKGICGSQAELLRGGGEAALLAGGLEFFVVWRTGVIPANSNGGLMSLSGEARVIAKTVATTEE